MADEDSLTGQRGDAGPSVLIVSTHVAPASGYGGVAESVVDLARAFAALGRRVHLVASDASSPGRVTEDQVRALAGTPVSLFASRRAKRLGFGLGALPLVWRAVGAADGVYVGGVTNWPVSLALLFCRLRRKPFVLGLRGGFMREHLEVIERRKPLKALFYRRFVRPLAGGARAIHAMSLPERDQAAGLFRAPFVVASLGVDCAAIEPAPPLPPLEGGGRRFVYVGRFSPEKSVQAMLTAWIAAASPHDRLTLVGDGEGAYAEGVKQAARADARVSCPGYRPRAEVLALLAAHDFLVLPSGMEGDVRENFGIAVAEALAVQRPALVAGGLAWDDLESEGAGLVFAPTPEGLAAALGRAAALGAADYAEMARRARRYAEERVDMREGAARLLRSIEGQGQGGGGGDGDVA